MIIYEFSTWSAPKGKLFTVKEIEVEEKPKTYIGRGCRINKDEIDHLSSHYGHRMYRLTNDPSLYIEKMTELVRLRLERLKQDVIATTETLNKWKGWAR